MNQQDFLYSLICNAKHTHLKIWFQVLNLGTILFLQSNGIMRDIHHHSHSHLSYEVITTAFYCEHIYVHMCTHITCAHRCTHCFRKTSYFMTFLKTQGKFLFYLLSWQSTGEHMSVLQSTALSAENVIQMKQRQLE